MSFNLIRVGNVRNLRHVDISPAPGINLLFGKNASGKSSLLEAIFILGRGKSFRDNQLSNVINRESSSLTVFGKMTSADETTNIGVEYSRQGIKAKVNGEIVKKLSSLAERTPIQVISPNTLEILEKGSQYRRSLIDWGVFHVEHSYRGLFSRYRRVLAQRNAFLKQLPVHNEDAWSTSLITLGQELHDTRQAYVKKLTKAFEKRCFQLRLDNPPQLELYPGWNLNRSLEEAMEESIKQDYKNGYSTVGPHRADLLFRDKRKELKKWGSRGQIKMVLIALILAQTDLLKERKQKNSIILLDDLSAELDNSNLQNTYSLLEETYSQIFITTIELDRYSSMHSGSLFHVEHGSISQVSV